MIEGIIRNLFVKRMTNSNCQLCNVKFRKYKIIDYYYCSCIIIYIEPSLTNILIDTWIVIIEECNDMMLDLNNRISSKNNRI